MVGVNPNKLKYKNMQLEGMALNFNILIHHYKGPTHIPYTESVKLITRDLDLYGSGKESY